MVTLTEINRGAADEGLSQKVKVNPEAVVMVTEDVDGGPAEVTLVTGDKLMVEETVAEVESLVEQAILRRASAAQAARREVDRRFGRVGC